MQERQLNSQIEEFIKGFLRKHVVESLVRELLKQEYYTLEYLQLFHSHSSNADLNGLYNVLQASGFQQWINFLNAAAKVTTQTRQDHSSRRYYTHAIRSNPKDPSSLTCLLFNKAQGEEGVSVLIFKISFVPENPIIYFVSENELKLLSSNQTIDLLRQ
jgi:hypothetical protein